MSVIARLRKLRSEGAVGLLAIWLVCIVVLLPLDANPDSIRRPLRWVGDALGSVVFLWLMLPFLAVPIAQLLVSRTRVFRRSGIASAVALSVLGLVLGGAILRWPYGISPSTIFPRSLVIATVASAVYISLRRTRNLAGHAAPDPRAR